MLEPRYAVYFAPPSGSALDLAGSQWVGRDATPGTVLSQPDCPGLTPERLAALTAAPRRYGFHGTLKPPFRLQAGRTVAALGAAVEALAARQVAFCFHVQLAALRGFFAWVPTDAQEQIGSIAAACVTELDGFRAPPYETELARRRPGLSPHQTDLLERWGYPWVLDEFRFHLTLSDTVAGHEAEALHAALRTHTAQHAVGRVTFDALCLFVEPQPGADFRLLARYGFDGSTDLPPSHHG